MTVSVIVPAYNCEAYLGVTLRSISLQSERDLEIVVVDDGSTDSTLQIAREAAAADERVIVISQENSGTPSAPRNAGIRRSTGEFITFLDADDLYHPDKVKFELDAFAACSSLDVVFCDVAKFSGEEPPVGARGFLDEADFLKVAGDFLEHHSGSLYRCRKSFYEFMSTKITSIGTQSVMVRRSALLAQQTWFREDWHVGEDIDLWFRLAANGNVGFVDRTLSYYRHRPGSLMSDSERAVRGAIQAHSANLDRARSLLCESDVALLRQRVAHQHRILGYMLLQKGDSRGARAAYRAAHANFPSGHITWDLLRTYVPRGIAQLARRIG